MASLFFCFDSEESGSVAPKGIWTAVGSPMNAVPSGAKEESVMDALTPSVPEPGTILCCKNNEDEDAVAPVDEAAVLAGDPGRCAFPDAFVKDFLVRREKCRKLRAAAMLARKQKSKALRDAAHGPYADAAEDAIARIGMDGGPPAPPSPRPPSPRYPVIDAGVIDEDRLAEYLVVRHERELKNAAAGTNCGVDTRCRLGMTCLHATIECVPPTPPPPGRKPRRAPMRPFPLGGGTARVARARASNSRRSFSSSSSSART